VVGAVFEPAYS